MFNIFKRSKKKIKFVYNDDLAFYLESLGAKEDIQSGKYKCSSCGEIITIENIGAIVPHEREIKFLCLKKKCFSKI